MNYNSNYSVELTHKQWMDIQYALGFTEADFSIKGKDETVEDYQEISAEINKQLVQQDKK